MVQITGGGETNRIFTPFKRRDTKVHFVLCPGLEKESVLIYSKVNIMKRKKKLLLDPGDKEADSWPSGPCFNSLIDRRTCYAFSLR